jgi:hypothetical protein
VTFVTQKCFQDKCTSSPLLNVFALSLYRILKLALILQLPLTTPPRSEGILETLSLDGILLRETGPDGGIFGGINLSGF